MTPSLPDDLLQRLAEAALRRYAAEVGLCAKPKVTLMVPDLPDDGAARKFVVTATVIDLTRDRPRSYDIEVTAHPLH